MKIKNLLSVLLISLVIANPLFAFAQLGGVSAPAPAVTPPPLPPVEPVVQIITPPTDTTAPVISGVANLSLGITDGTIVWTTDELAVSTLEYGTTQSYGHQATLSVSALLAHTAILTGLSPNTTYYYCIHAADLVGNAINSCGHSFTTAAEPVIADTVPPNITLVTVAPITTTSATINFTTSEVGNARVEYGITAGYGETTALDTNLALNHSVILSNLNPNTEYHYRIISSDEVGNETITSDETFTTEAIAQTGQGTGGGGVSTTGSESTSVNTSVDSVNASVLLSAIETESVATSSVTITWNTDFPSDSQVEYGNSENFGSLTPLNSALTTSHAVTIAGLAVNTNYIFRVKSKPLGAAAATVSNNYEFNTLNNSAPVAEAPNILSVTAAPASSSDVLITWATNKGGTSQVQYGLNSSYGETSILYQEYANYHSVLLSHLDSGTTYHFRVESADEVSNLTFSEDYTFTTPGPANQSVSAASSVPAAVTTLAVGGYDQNSVALEWNAASVNSDAAQEYDVRYSGSPITESNFANAAQAQLTPIYHGDLSPNGTARTYIVAGLSPGAAYYFAVKSKHENSGYSDISNVVAATTTTGVSINNESKAGGGGGGSSVVSEEYSNSSAGNAGVGAAYSFEPTVIKAEPADNQIIFEWNNPGEANFVRTVVVRKEGSYPASPSDGQILYEGREKTFTDTNVQNGITYYYALYSYNHSKTYSNPVHISLAPNAGNNEVKFIEVGSLASSTPIMHFVRILKKGDKDIEIEHLQEILSVDQDAYPEKYVTGYFGSLTQTALQRFQKKHGLSQTGIVDAVTQKELNTVSQSETKLDIPTDYAVFNSDLKYGDSGELVKNLQQYLIYEGSYSEALITSYFGNRTRNAVMKFQKKYGIVPVSGYVGYKTRHRMQQLAGL